MSDEEDGLDSLLNTAGDGVQLAGQRQQTFSLPPVPPNQGPPSISLAYLIDFAVQRTYQDLTVLAELLPKKSDMERKISIVQFAHSTRQLFIRLLAVVRWAKSAGKVDLCMGISYFLDQQASIFVEAADRLFQLSREVLPQARLPAFQIPAAVDVLVLGSYPRLPAVIKTRFVPDDTITLREQTCVLRRLNQVIQQRLIFSPVQLPDQMQNFTIRNGTVTFVVPGEFEASLTLLGEDANVPWSLLNIKILVEDYDIGEGSDLVHSFQLHYIHELVEARMLSSDDPITELYNILHTFCVYLQLDILFCQASKFVHDRMIEYISVDEYVQGYKLTMTYWKTVAKRPLMAGAASATVSTPTYPGFNYKLMIHVDLSGTKKALRVVHIPSADVRLPTLDDYGNGNAKLNIENLLCDTVVARIRHRLVQLKQRLASPLTQNVRLTGTVPTLEISLLEPLVETERLNVSINLFTGYFVCSIASLGKAKALDELERVLNLAQWHRMRERLYDLKVTLLMERCRRTAVGLPVLRIDSVPLLPSSTATKFLSPHRLFFRFSRHETFYLVVEFLPEGQVDCKLRYHLLSTCSAASLMSTMNTDKCREMFGVCEFVKPVTILPLDPTSFALTGRPNKSSKVDPYLMSELTTVITNCDQRMPFIVLREEFERKGIKTQALREEGGIGCIVLNVQGFAELPSNEDKALIESLWSKAVVRLSGRLMHDRSRLHWSFELITCNIPLMGVHQRHGCVQSNDQHIRMTVLNAPMSLDGASKCADDVLSAVCAFGRLYDLVVRFASPFKKFMHEVCQVISLSINRLVLSYGPSRRYFVMIQWKQQEANFHLSFGTHTSGDQGSKVDVGITATSNIAENPHSLMVSFVQTMFNERRDLAHLMHYLNDTIDPLLSLQLLPQWPTIGVGESTMLQQGGHGHLFTILPVSGNVLHVMYKWHLCFECTVMANGEVALRDCGAGAQQQTMKSASRFAPIVGFKSFFMLHEQLAGTSVTNAPIVQPLSRSPVRQPIKQESLEKVAGSPSKTRIDSVKTESQTSSPGGAMIAPSPLSASTPVVGTGVVSQPPHSTGFGSMTPSPAPAASSFAGLLTPSPAAGPLSNAGMLMTPSPAPFPLQSPAPGAAQSVSSTGSAAANSNAPPPLSPAGPEPSPLSFMKSFASAASAAGTEAEGGGNEFSNWGDFSTVASVTPVTTTAPFPMESFPVVSSQPPSAPPTTTKAIGGPQSVGGAGGSPLNTDDWVPSSDPIIISHAALRSACSGTTDDNTATKPLKEYLGSYSTLEKFSKQPNSLPAISVPGPGQTSCKVGSLDMKIHLDQDKMTRLVLRITNNMDCPELWTDDDLRVMEQYFAEYVAPLQHHHAITTYLRFLLFSKAVHTGAPKSLVQLMRHQLQHDTTRPWSASLCLILPPPHLMTPPLPVIGQTPITPGMMAIMVNRDQRKMLLWIKLTSNMDQRQRWIFPLLYDGESNGLTVFAGSAGAVQQQSSTLTQYPVIGEVNNILQRHQSYTSDCSIWTSVNGLAGSLSHQQAQQQDEAKT